MAERWRFYLAGATHAVGGVWVAGWALSSWVPTLDAPFGPLGWMPAPIALMLLTLSGTLVLWGDAPQWTNPPNPSPKSFISGYVRRECRSRPP